jgi:hypothetical protein
MPGFGDFVNNLSSVGENLYNNFMNIDHEKIADKGNKYIDSAVMANSHYDPNILHKFEQGISRMDPRSSGYGQRMESLLDGLLSRNSQVTPHMGDLDALRRAYMLKARHDVYGEDPSGLNNHNRIFNKQVDSSIDAMLRGLARRYASGKGVTNEIQDYINALTQQGSKHYGLSYDDASNRVHNRWREIMHQGSPSRLDMPS